MDDANVNGGNADEARENPNLETGSMPELQETQDNVETTAKIDGQEVNGDIKGSSKKSPIVRRKMRKFKANSTSTIESDTPLDTKGRKRKLSEPDDASSDESMEVYGFDVQEAKNVQLRIHILRKLIAEAETETQLAKRNKYSIKRNFDGRKDDHDSDDGKMHHYDTEHILDVEIIKKEKESDKSETDSIGIPNTMEFESEVQKSEDAMIKSTNSSAGSSRQKAAVDITNPAFKEPFKYGWKRELVFRASTDSSLKRMADIYYYTPKGKKVRSFREVAEFLNTKELTIDNFTFFKEPVGIDDPEKEIIRDAKRMRGSMGPSTVSPRKNVPYKKSTPGRRAVAESPASAPAPVPTKVASKSPKAASTGFKVKVPAKRTPQIKIKPSFEESEMLPPQRTTSTRRSQQLVEKPPPPKPKRKLTRKQHHQETEQQPHFMDSVSAGYHALLRIFQYLKVQELLRAARVCKMWRDLAAHPSLWKTVRMKNSQVTDWDGLADTLQRRGTQHLDLRKMLVAGESDSIWKKFLLVIPRVTSLVKLELCRCPVMVVEEVIKGCPQLEVLSAMSIKCDTLNLESVGNLKRCQELRLKAISGMSLQEDLTPLHELTQLSQLSLTSVKELGKKKIDIIQTLVNLETLELGECSDFPDKFGTTVLIKLQKLERLRLEKGQGSCCTFDILDGVSKLQNLSQMELVNFDVKNGFDKCLANCKNIKRLLIIPTYISQSATSNNMVLGGVTELSNNLTHFVWGVTLELLRVTELFVDQCNLMNKQVTGDSIPVLKPVPCLKLIEDVGDENDNQKGDDKQQPNLTNPQVDILPLPQLQKLLLTALPKTRVKILKIPFHATWRQSISDTATQ
ncbi:uncharacterized protein LOC128896072 isoform X4 [Hylaeus anthracinus]|uniref:uncharacterized protein LOC128896072 isoform X4 n=1 Tax=Hylaeus anthracinus TaxID=313031 RepID=UPI0023B93F50|nr:uncharacterized protein LOC128896072 isoform X4 [Hylaeus anthracinus]